MRINSIYLLFLPFLILIMTGTGYGQKMEDYCQVPPYVIQNVPPNVMIVLDNSGSMFNFAYACPQAWATGSGSNTNIIPVKTNNLSGFKRGHKILVGSTMVEVESVDNSASTITVTAGVSYSQGTLIQDYGCSGSLFYETPYSSCPSNYTTNSGSGVTLIPVNSTSNFWVGQIIVIVSGGVPYERVISSINPSDKKLTVTQAVTFNKNDYIYDYSCYYFRNLYPEQSFNPDKEYYGYFDPNYWYVYSSSGKKFVPNRQKIAGAKQATEWDGNFLNWLTMRRVDVIRKVMTGGRAVGGEGTGFDKLRTEIADYEGRGVYKAITNAENYMGCTGCSGNVNFVFSTGSSSPSSFTAYTSTGASLGSYNVDVRVPVPVEGVLQSVVGSRARIGLTFYKTYDGGYVQVYISGGSLSSTVNQINLTRPSTNTPLGETLWTVAGYFAQQSSISSIGTPGPRYSSGDYQINNNVDPLNYGTGGSPIFRSCAKNFVLFITDGEPCDDGDLPSSLSNYASGRSDYNCSGSSCPAVGPFPASTLPSCSAGGYVAGIEDVALWAHTTDLRNYGGTPNIGKDNIAGIQNLTLYTVFAFGMGSTLLKYAAINGGFEDTNGNNVPDLQSEWDANGDNKPDTYYEANQGDELEKAIRDAFLSILKRAASGTAASVLASGEGQGANLIQAVFYPRRRIGNEVIAWTGAIQNLWYHVDPLFSTSSIREDTYNDYKLNLSNDDIVKLYFDTASQTTRAKLYDDSNADGLPDSSTPYAIKNFDDLYNPLKYLWEAGRILWSRDLSTNPRTIYTSCISGTTCSRNLSVFSTSNATHLAPYLNVTDVDGDGSTTGEAEDVIRYIHGEALTTLTDSEGNVIVTGVDRNGDGIDDYRARWATIGSDTNVWKLGDVLNSTPRIASWLPINNYHKKYNDETYKQYITSTTYTNRNMVFAGGNDGMLHAFKLGDLGLPNSSHTAGCSFSYGDKACLNGTNLGEEKWAFIPTNVLPYLVYLLNPEYCHIYTVDLPPYIVDASIGTTDCTETYYWDCDKTNVSDPAYRWRTILIGGMRTGGACRNIGSSCTDCVLTPMKDLGYSSYFALDITDPLNPKLLWEFSNQQLGFTTTGPAVVRISARNNDGSINNDKNGRWFVIFGSGPTGPITTDWQFLGKSDQNLRLFILDLATGNLVRTIDTGIQFAFAGSMVNSTHDSDLNYQDEVVYIGYTRRTSSSPYSWTDGGIIRLVTKESLNVNDWRADTLIDGIGPVTASITHLQKNNGCITKKASGDVTGCLWLLFGTGRYHYTRENDIDDKDGQRRLFGFKEPCVKLGTNGITIDTTCTSQVSFSSLRNVTDISNVPDDNTANEASFNGWYVNLDLCLDVNNNPVSCTSSSAYYAAERIITDPLATTTGVIFFTSMKPYIDVCSIGGKSSIWALRYNTGGAPGALLKGVALIQLSTAAIEQVNLSTAFTEKGGRRSSSIEGLPPTSSGFSIMSTPPPIKRILHIKER